MLVKRNIMEFLVASDKFLKQNTLFLDEKVYTMLQRNVKDIHKKSVAKQKGKNQMDYNSIDIVELKTILKLLQFELEDLEEALNFNFTYTSAHIGGREVRKDEERLRQLKEKIAKINEILSVI
jgi:hypothetical protein